MRKLQIYYLMRIFRYDGNEEWTQIPIQIDEMHMQDWEIIKSGDCR